MPRVNLWEALGMADLIEAGQEEGPGMRLYEADMSIGDREDLIVVIFDGSCIPLQLSDYAEQIRQMQVGEHIHISGPDVAAFVQAIDQAPEPDPNTIYIREELEQALYPAHIRLHTLGVQQ